MKKPFNQRKIISILFISAAAILLLNLIFDKFFTESPKHEEPETTTVEIDSVFHSVLFNFGIQEEWIKEKQGKLLVNIPKDLPAILILQEMNNVFDTNEVKINVFEKKIGGTTTLNFFSTNEEKLKAELIYSDKVKRKSVRIGFIVERSGDVYESDSLLLEYPEQFAILLIPSAGSEEFVKKILVNGKEYIIYLNDEIDDVKFKLRSEFSNVRLRNSIREIVGSFPNAVFFMSDDNSLLYNSMIYPQLKEAMEKRKINLIERSNFYDLAEAGDENYLDVFNEILDNTAGGEDRIIIISAERFLELNPEILRYRKIGYRFTNPSALIK